LSRKIKTFLVSIETSIICQDFFLTFLDLLDLFSIEIIRLFHYFSIEIEKYSRSMQKYAAITDISICLEKSWSRLTSSRLNQEILISTEIIHHVETNFWKPSRFSQPSRLTLFWRRDRESWSRPRRDKSRPPRLN
jgi:hypothetical protein